jgi:hypothetical protein
VRRFTLALVTAAALLGGCDRASHDTGDVGGVASPHRAPRGSNDTAGHETNAANGQRAQMPSYQSIRGSELRSLLVGRTLRPGPRPGGGSARQAEVFLPDGTVVILLENGVSLRGRYYLEDELVCTRPDEKSESCRRILRNPAGRLYEEFDTYRSARLPITIS